MQTVETHFDKVFFQTDLLTPSQKQRLSSVFSENINLPANRRKVAVEYELTKQNVLEVLSAQCIVIKAEINRAFFGDESLCRMLVKLGIILEFAVLCGISERAIQAIFHETFPDSMLK